MPGVSEGDSTDGNLQNSASAEMEDWNFRLLDHSDE